MKYKFNNSFLSSFLSLSYLVLGTIVISGFLLSCDRLNERDYLISLSPSDSTDISPFAKRVLIEDLTGTRCPNCPRAMRTANDLQGLYPGRVIVLANHGSYQYVRSLSSPDSLTSEVGDFFYKTYFQNVGNSLPQGLINRRAGSNGKLFADAEWALAVSKEVDLMSDFSVKIEPTYKESSKTLEAKIEISTAKALEGSYSLTVLIVQDGIIHPQAEGAELVSDYVHKHVLRDAISSASGDVLNSGAISKGEVLHKQYTYTFPKQWARGGFVDASSCSLIAFVSDLASGEILQSSLSLKLAD
ncbi:hypothetical protein AwDysgo_10930 [Bacteroidales bacterium]|nr:hypothetical protein AwDysgo_10930 [Bacteroidales bacterium]